MNGSDIGAAVDLGLDQATMATLSADSLAGMDFPGVTANTFDFSGLGPSMTFDLDPLDWGLLDNYISAYHKDGETIATTASSSPDQGILPWDTRMGHSDTGESGVRGAAANIALPGGINMMQISPLEAHRIKIVQYLEKAEPGKRQWESWLTLDNMSNFMCSYFSFFHQHTPLLHLPLWNVTTCSTPLIFSIVLMGSMYSGKLKSHSSNARQLCHLAQSFAWESDRELGSHAETRLDTIQAVYLAILLEAFYFPSKAHPPGVSMTKLIDEARRAGVFQPLRARTEPWKMKWTEWSAQESRIRSVSKITAGEGDSCVRVC